MARVDDLRTEVTAKQKGFAELQRALDEGKTDGFDSIEAMEDELVRQDSDLREVERRYSQLASVKQREEVTAAAPASASEELQRTAGETEAEYQRSTIGDFNFVQAPEQGGSWGAQLRRSPGFMEGVQRKSGDRVMLNGAMDALFPNVLGGRASQAEMARQLMVANFLTDIPFAGYVPSAGVVTGAVDVIPRFPVDKTRFDWLLQTTRDNQAAVRAEGRTASESNFDTTRQNVTLKHIATSIPLTEELAQSEVMIEGLLRQLLTTFIREKANADVIDGDGSASDLSGFGTAGRTGLGAAAADIADNAPRGFVNAISAAVEYIRFTGEAAATGAIIHPTAARMMRDDYDANGGGWVLQHPGAPNLMRVHGVDVVESGGFPAKTANAVCLIVGDFPRYSYLATMGDITTQISDSHGTTFLDYELTIRAGMWAEMVISRNSAFWKAEWAA